MNIIEKAIVFFAEAVRESAKARIAQYEKNQKMFKTGVKYWDVKSMPVFPDEPPERHQMRKWLSQVPHGGIVDDVAVVVCYNEQRPEQSYLIIEGNKS